MKEILRSLFEYKTLTRQQAKEVLTKMGKGAYSEPEIASFTTVFLMRSITIEELSGFRDALIELCVPIKLEQQDLIDIVGTGGDGKNTFNISTLSCFLVAGAGQMVAKHGNYGATSVSGSSNVMENLGYKFSADNKKLQAEVDKAGICFLHAPLFHPALKVVAPVRKNLGIRTFFNMLGPLVNPSKPNLQLVGVYNLEMARIYHYFYQQSGNKFMIVHSMDGYDEVSLTGDAKVITEEGEFIYDPIFLGKRTVHASDIHGGSSPEEAADIFLKILKGKGSWAQHAVVVANAALALLSSGQYSSYDDCYAAALESLESGKAYQHFTTLMNMQA